MGFSKLIIGGILGTHPEFVSCRIRGASPESQFPIPLGGSRVKFNGAEVPASGQKITLSGTSLVVPDNPIIPFIEGDGTGRDIWRASKLVFDSAVEKAYGGKRHIAWYEIFAGEKAFNQFKDWLPEESVDAIRD